MLVPMFGFRLVLLLTTAGWACAQSASQSASDAATLVEEAATLARSGKSWRAEGSLVTRGADGKDQPAVSFKIAFLVPRYARLEIAGGEAPLLRICEGSAQWTYYPSLQGFVRVLLPQIGPCAFPVNAWPPLSNTLQSPVLAGTETVTVNGQPRACQVVRGAFTWPGRDPGVKEIVTLCIDRQSLHILRYQLQHLAPGEPSTRTYTFAAIEFNPELPSNLFDFQAPEGSRALATIDWLTPIPSASPGVYRVSDDVSAPILTEVMPPKYPAEAALLSGGNTVTLHVEIGPDGIPHNVQVARSLGAGLDEEAVKCVKRWRFQPGMSAAGPIAVAATVLVHFMDPVHR
jgi:TonB family protein